MAPMITWVLREQSQNPIPDLGFLICHCLPVGPLHRQKNRFVFYSLLIWPSRKPGHFIVEGYAALIFFSIVSGLRGWQPGIFVLHTAYLLTQLV